MLTRHERIASPSTTTMHAPQSPLPQPYLVPVRFEASRSAQSSGVSGSSLYWTGRSLTVNLVMGSALIRAALASHPCTDRPDADQSRQLGSILSTLRTIAAKSGTPAPIG